MFLIPRSSVTQFKAYFKPSTSTTPTPARTFDADEPVNLSPDLDAVLFGGYEADLPDDEPLEPPILSDDEHEHAGVCEDEHEEDVGGCSNDCDSDQNEEPIRKRQRRVLDIPVLEARHHKQRARRIKLERALSSVDKKIRSRKTTWTGGEHGLEAMCARAIRVYLQLVLKGVKGLPASKIAAQSSNLVKFQGSRAIRQWANHWIRTEDLPTSQRGCHIKVSSLLDDPEITAECRSYLRSNKWATNPRKFSEFVNQTMLPAEAEKYAKDIVDKEMPHGMKHYLELVLFPCIQLKVGKGISLSTARNWMHRQGFYYQQYKKALYFDGHEHPDVVEYWQNMFLPEMAEYRHRLVEYVVGNVDEEVIKLLPPGIRKLVLMAHDEATMQANDGEKAGWGPKDEQPLLKKGVGRGSHRSDVICSTFGHLEDAGQQLEYRRNYDGYWTGELFVKQAFYFCFLF